MSSVLQRPSGDSMPAAVNMLSVRASKVRSAAVIMPLAQAPPCSMEAAREVAERDEEQAVSMLMAGPALCVFSPRFQEIL